MIGTEKARKEYRETRSNQKIQQFALSLKNDNSGSTQIPEKKESRVGKFLTDYEPVLIFWIIVLLFIGFSLIKFSFTSLPKNNPLNMSDLTRRSLVLMCASFFLSPGLLLLYIWKIKVGIL
jgi:hypothetical protein